jgi:CheY-like chemotaxis protein
LGAALASSRLSASRGSTPTALRISSAKRPNQHACQHLDLDQTLFRAALVYLVSGQTGWAWLTKTEATIAIVDDDASILTSTARLLTEHGYRTQTFVSAEEFLDSANTADADCLILDIALGGISGIELRQRLTAAGSRIPVIFISAAGYEATFRQAIEAGCVAYLPKPFSADLLISAINEAMALADTEMR